MSNIIIDIAAQFTGKKAFKEADFTAKRLNQSVKNLAATFGVAFSARAFVNYSKMAVKAFAADDKAARTLTQTLNNLGLAFADTEVKTFISDLEKQFGVLDDLLRPAYQKLITTTGDFRKSQDLLKVALDLSAQSGQDVVSVASDLSQALIGNTKGLRKYNLGLTTAQLSAMSFEEVLARITKISAGQASLAADTYSGKLDKLKVAAANAEEVLGGAFLDTFIKLSGGDVDKATAAIDKYSTGLATMLRLLTGVISKQEVLSKVDFKFGLIPVEKGKVSTNRSGSPAGTFMRNQAEIKAAAEAKRLAAEQAKSGKALLKSQQDQLKLAKAKAVFDLQKINIEAALKGKISEEDKIRLNLMKAIEEENLAAADKYQKALDKSQEKTTALAALLATVKAMEVKDPFSTWSIDPLTASINALTTSIGGVGTAITASGTEWSSFTGTVATTVIQPNLKEFSSSFTNAINAIVASTATASTEITTLSSTASATAATAATAAANSTAAALTSTSSSFTNAIDGIITSFENAVTGLGTLTTSASKTASDAALALTNTNNEALASTTAAATQAAIEAAAAATVAANAALTSTSATATEAIGSSTTSATDTTVLAIATSGSATADAIIGTSQAAADALDKLYSDSNTALTNATTVTVTDFMATSSAALSNLREVLATEAANYAAAAAATSAQAAADRADLAGIGNAGSNVTIIVEGSVIAENDLATIVNDAINNSSAAGNAIGYNRTANTMAIE